VAGGALLQLVRLAPLGNALAYVLDNDIYYRPSSYFGTEERRITFSGIPGVFYNGVPDWVYEGDYSIALVFISTDLHFIRETAGSIPRQDTAYPYS
jgi:hypothetical protein